MAREKKKSKTQNEEENPQAVERSRLKNLARTNNLLSQTPATPFTSLSPSETIIKHHGADIIKKSQRKNRYLFSFNALLAPISGGKIGDLTHLTSKNPILYLDFPQGRMKLLGTIVYPKNRYLTLQFSKGGKNVMCEDCFDTMIVFSDAYWIGNKDKNPDEARLDFPKELYEREQSEVDFQGGAGASVVLNKTAKKVAATTPVKQTKVAKTVAAISTEQDPISDSPIDDTETQSPERPENLKDLEYTTPVRHSERTAGRRFNFTEVSSGDDSAGSASDMSANDKAAKNDFKDVISKTAVEAHDSDDTQHSTVQPPMSSMSSSGEAKLSRSSRVQATISTLFKKVEQKSTVDAMKMVPEKGSSKIGLPNNSKSKNKSVNMQLVPEPDEMPKEKKASQARRAGTSSMKGKRKAVAAEVEDDIVEFSSLSEETDESDDWRASR